MDKPTTRGNILRKTTLAIALVSAYGYMPISAAQTVKAGDGQTINLPGDVSPPYSRVEAEGTGVVIGSDVDLSGEVKQAVHAYGGGTINLSGGTVENTSTAPGAMGITATGVGSSIIGNNLQISAKGEYHTAGETSRVVDVRDNAHVELTGGSITSLSNQNGRGIMAVENGIVTTNGVNIDTRGTESHAVHAYTDTRTTSNQPAITMDGGEITTQGQDAYGLYADNGVTPIVEGAVITASDVSVTTTGLRADAVKAHGGGVVNLDTVEVMTSGQQAHGIHANNTGKLIIKDSVAEATGAESAAAFIESGGHLDATGSTFSSKLSNGLRVEDATANLANSQVTSTGTGADKDDLRVALSASGEQSVVNLTGGSVEATGSGFTRGISVLSEAHVTTNGTDISTAGHNSHAVHASGNGSTADIQGGEILTIGNESSGLYAQNGGKITSSADIVTEGDAGFGAFGWNKGDITLNGGSINTSGGVFNKGGGDTTGTHGVLSMEGSTITLDGTNVTTIGERADGLRAETSTTGGTITATDATIQTGGEQANGISAIGEGSTVSMDGGSVTVTGEQAVAAHAAAGGHLDIANATLTNENAGIKSHGVVVEGTGSTAQLTESHISINGSSASHGTGMPFGIFAHDNGEVTMTGGSIQAHGEKYNRGIYASTGGTVNAEGIAISTSGTNSHAVHALGKVGENAPTINVKGGTVSTAENESYGLYAQDGGKITSSADIVTKGDAGFGVYGWNGDIELTGGSVTTSGGVFTKTDGGTTGTHGVLAMKGSTITLDGTSVTTTGERADGFRAETSTTGASIIGTNVDIDTSGKGAHGVSAIGQGSSVTMNGGSITTTGADSSGAFLEGGSSITLNNVKVEAAGASITSNLTGAGQEQTITIGSGSELMKNNGTLWSVMRADGANGTVTLDLQGGSVVWGNVIENGGAVADVDMTKVILDPDAVWAGVIVDDDTEVVAEGDSQNFDNSPIGQLVTGTGSSATFTNGANIADSVSAGIASNVTFNGDTSIGADVNAMPASRLAFNGPTAIGGSVVAVNGAQLGFNGPSTSIGGDVTLTGAGTAVHGGTIAAPIEIAGDARVDSGAILGGNLNVAGELSGNGGVLSPGNSMGKQTYGSVAGFTGDYHAEINAAGASDQVTIGSGNFDLTGINLFVAEENGNAGYRLNHDYTIVKTEKADGISSVTDNKFANDGQLVGSLNQSLVKLDPVTYGDNDVKVSLSLDEEKVATARSGLSKNQNATLDGVSSVLGRNAAADAAVTSADFKGALNQLSGEVHASTQTALINSSDLLVRTLSNRMRGNVGSGMIAGAPTAQSSGAVSGSMPTSAAYPLWAEVVGSWSKLDGNGNAADTKTRIGGLFIGGDTAVGNGWRVGGALGFTDGRVEVDDRSSKSDIKGYTAALYGGNSWATSNGNINLLGGAAYTYHEIDSRRTVNVGGSQTLEADYKANTTQLFAELGYAFPVGQASTVEPYLGVAWLNQRAKGFSETGGAAALQGDSQHDDVTTTTLGLRGTTMLDMGEKQALLKAGLGWRHAAGDIETSRRMSFAQSNGAQFKVAGAPIAKNAAVVDLGAEVSIGKATSLGLSYSGQFGDGNTDNAGSLYLKVRFN